MSWIAIQALLLWVLSVQLAALGSVGTVGERQEGDGVPGAAGERREEGGAWEGEGAGEGACERVGMVGGRVASPHPSSPVALGHLPSLSQLISQAWGGVLHPNTWVVPGVAVLAGRSSTWLQAQVSGHLGRGIGCFRVVILLGGGVIVAVLVWLC